MSVPPVRTSVTSTSIISVFLSRSFLKLTIVCAEWTSTYAWSTLLFGELPSARAELVKTCCGLFGREKVASGDLLRAFLSSQSCDGADDEVGKRDRETSSEVGSSLPRLRCSTARFSIGIDSEAQLQCY